MQKSKWVSLGVMGLFIVSLLPIAAAAAPEDESQTQTERIELSFAGYRFDPVLDGEPVMAPDQVASGTEPGLHLIQFEGPTQDVWLDQLMALGLPILQYYPNYSYLTWGTQAQVESAGALNFVRWQGKFHPAYKVNSSLDELSGNVQNVDVMFYNDGNIAATLAELEALGANILSSYPSQPDKAFYNAIVEMDAAGFSSAAQLKTVLALDYVSPVPILDDEMSSQIVAGNHPGGVPATGYNAHLANLGYDGSGVIWAVIDTGVDYDHPDLGSHIVGGYSFPGACNTNPGEDCAGGGHGTHVAGIIGGDATGAFTDPSGFLYGLGVAPEYSIFAMNSLSTGPWPPAGGWQEHSKQAVLGNAVGGNNSWTTGEGTNHGYQASERTHDIMVRDGNFDTANTAEPFIEVFSAGNSGPSGSTLTAPKEGKNLIVVASSDNYRAVGNNINAISDFSSRGPAVDGRWVPTVAAPGANISSSRNDLGGSCSTAILGTNNLYAFCSGTSMAAPHVSGAIVLTTEWWRTFNSGDDPSPAMAKALMVNGAVDMGAADIPNVNEGWGRINATNVISASVATHYIDQTVVFSATAQAKVYSFSVDDPSHPLKITLAWSDAPGAVSANPALVNNLDLSVEHGGTTYLGNQFTGGWSSAGGSPDNINNLENVYIASPGGTFTITVAATNVAGDGVPYNGDMTDQDFALVCTNCTSNLPPEIAVDPGALASAQMANTVVMKTLTISNIGSGDLDWSILEAPGKTDAASSPEIFSPQAAAPAPVVSSAAECSLYENYPGAEPQGYAEFCLGGAVPSSSASGVFEAPTDTGFAQDIGFVSDNFVSFTLNDFPGQTVLGTPLTTPFGYDFDVTATTLYALDNAGQTLGTINLANGGYTAIGPSVPLAGHTWTGLTSDPTTGTFYASSTDGTTSALYTVNTATGAPNLVGTDTNASLLIDISVGPNGVMYGHDIGTDSIYTIDKSNGVTTLVGLTGYNANFAQGMDFDND
ncbi:MAG: S8 family serine peptidase, partial [Anaerolineales bacterium]|nr:S8 family serine peptidase [Anaerolineales bacterium]